MVNLNLIKSLAERQNISIRELADKVGVSENQIHVMCKTNSTKINTLEKIAKVLNVSINYFFDEDNSSSTSLKADDSLTGLNDHLLLIAKKSLEIRSIEKNLEERRSELNQLLDSIEN